MNIKRIAFAGGTFACAMGIGFFMQQSQASVPELAQPVAAVANPTPLAGIEPETAIVLPAKASILPSLKPITNVQTTLSPAGSASVGEDQDAVPKKTTLVEGCDVLLSGKDDRAAMIEVTLQAPCAGDQIATIHHEGLMFTLALDNSGSATFLMPVLTENALIIAALEGGEGAVLTHDVPTLGEYDRVAVQWKGDIGVELHAREWGSEYGEAGHVWYGAPRDAGAISYQVGFLTRLGTVTGEKSLVADVYTFPTVMSDGDGEIQMSVETEINAVNCAQDITAQTIQISPFAERVVHDLELSLPECDAIGDFVILALPVQDIQLASR